MQGLPELLGDRGPEDALKDERGGSTTVTSLTMLLVHLEIHPSDLRVGGAMSAKKQYIYSTTMQNIATPLAAVTGPPVAQWAAQP